MEPDIVAQFEAWVAQNPLRKFRMSRGLTQGQSALMLGVGLTAVQRWESGAHLPAEPNMQRLAEFMQETLTAVQERWATWYAQKPGGPHDRSLRGGRPIQG
jgi:transcriptional regulator with XRE-family HTH domain